MAQDIPTQKKNLRSTHDTFLADVVKPRGPQIGYVDGFRFGFGFFIAGLLIAVILGGLTWGAYMLLHLR